MSIIKFSDVSISYDTLDVLKKINLDINNGERIGIVGANGAGKSTLIKIIMQEIKPDNGKVSISNSTNIGYLKQATEYSMEDFMNMTTARDNVSEFLKLNSELNISKNIDFTEERLNNLSGGEKTKLALSAILATNPSLLLLDEPTNHVDLDSVNWLIQRLKNYNGTIMVVSHDRYFLNQVVDKIIEIEDGQLKIYYGNYDYYQKEKEAELLALRETYEQQQKEEKKIEKEIKQLKNWSEKGEREAGKQGGMRSDSKIKGVKTNAQRKAAKLGKGAENKKTRLEQMKKEHIEKPQDEKKIKFDFQGATSGANCLVRVSDLEKSYASRTIFNNVNLTINRTEKIGLIGPNGSGKSTFVKILLNQLEPTKGDIWKTPSLKVAYMSQDVFDLEEDKTIFEMTEKMDSEAKQFFFSNLANMGLNREMFNHKIKTLSLGERMRLKLVQIIVGDYNLLVLDEPTNHLDLPNKIQLEKALIDFPGAIVIASHDRFLLSKVTNKVFIFKDNTILRSEDSYSEYAEKTDAKTVVIEQSSSLTVEDKLRDIEEKMGQPGISDSQIQELLQIYYELLDIQENELSAKKR
jgi:macrolide transport system ATP-binding/permease protein